MPNIEVHGLSWWKARKIRRRIFDLFKETPYAHEVVVTIFSTKVTDIHAVNQPFLRLVNDRLKNAYEILVLLKRLGMDIEYLKLKQFIPRK